MKKREFKTPKLSNLEAATPHFEVDMLRAIMGMGDSYGYGYGYGYDCEYAYDMGYLDEVVVIGYAPTPTPAPPSPPFGGWPPNIGENPPGDTSPPANCNICRDIGCPFCRGTGPGQGGEIGGGGGGGGIAPPPPSSPLPGRVDPNNFTFQGIQGNFRSQLNRILGSNREIGFLLEFFDLKIVRMTFRLENLGTGSESVPALLRANNPNSYYIVFNAHFFNNNNGLTRSITSCSAGFDWSQATTPEQRLVVVLAHEALHARHVALRDMAVREAQSRGHQGATAVAHYAATWLLARGFNRDLVNTFFVESADGRWGYRQDGEDIRQRMENLIRDHNQGTLNNALNQFRNDFPPGK